MRCKICCRSDVKEVNLELLQRVGRRVGTVMMMAKRLGVDRATLWRHRKFHLKIYTSRKPIDTKDLSFEERARLLAMEADRLQLQVENGVPREVADQGLKALALRVKLLELEAKFAGRPMTQKREAVDLTDPDEETQALKEFEEVCGTAER